MAASENRSSPRVAPRSVIRATATSSMIFSIVSASDSTQPVSVMSPTVRNRTVRFRTVGDLTLTGCVESEADTIEKIIEEIAIARVTERGATRGDDRFSEAAMEDRKKEGYF